MNYIFSQFSFNCNKLYSIYLYVLTVNIFNFTREQSVYEQI